MSRSVVYRREELLGDARLDLGGVSIPLSDYATTGIRAIGIGPSGGGKTNAGLVISEQLSALGWVTCLVDAEQELAALYGDPVESPEALYEALSRRDKEVLVVPARDATEFVPYGEVIKRAADEHRKPIFLMIDEGQLFSASRRRKNDIGAASDLVNEFFERGRKRALDVYITAHRFSGSINRSAFSNKNLTLIGSQNDPLAWQALAPQFRGSKIGYQDLAALAPGEFFVFSRSGVEKTMLPMAKALARVAPKATVVKQALPTTFSQWDRAMSEIPDERLAALTDPVIALLATVAGLAPQQVATGRRALVDEIEARA